MANKAIRGITVEIGGDTTKLGKALESSEKQSRSLQVELRQIEKMLKFDPSNIELLAQKQDVLTDAVSETTKKLDTLKEAEKQVIAQFEKGDIGEDQLRAFQREIMQTEKNLAGMESELSQTQDKIKELSNETGKGKQNTKEYEEAVKDAKEAVADFGESAGEMFEVLAGGATVLATSAGAVAGYALNMSTEFDKAFNTLVTKTGATKEEMDGLNTAMENVYANNFGESIEDVANSMATVKTTTNLAGEELESATEKALLMRDVFDFEVNESVRAVNSMMDQFGITAEEAYNLIAQGAQRGLNQNDDLLDTINEYSVHFQRAGYSADDMFNMLANGVETGTWSVDKLGDAVKEFNIRMSDGSAKDAVEALGFSWDAVSESWSEGGESAKEVFNMLVNELDGLEQTTEGYEIGVGLLGTMFEDLGFDAVYSLSQVDGSISKSSDALKQLNEIKYDDIGSAIQGLKRELEVGVVEPLGDELKPVVEDAIEYVKENGPQIKEILANIVTKIGEFVGFIVNNGPTILSIIAGIGGAFAMWKVASMIAGLIGVITKFVGILKTGSTVMGALNAVMAVNPIVLIVSLIAGLIVAFITLWNTSEGFRNFWINLWEKIKTVFGIVCDAIVNFFTVTIPNAFSNFVTFLGNIVNNIVTFFTVTVPNAWSSFLTFVGNFINNIVTFFSQLPGRIWAFLVNVVTSIANWGVNLYNTAVNAVRNMINNVVTFFSQLPYKIGYALGFVIGKLISFGQQAIAWVKTNVPRIISNIVNFFATLPSRIWTFLKNVISRVISWGASVKEKATTAIKNMVSSVVSFASQLPGKIWSAIQSAITFVTTWGSRILSTAKNAITKMVSSVVSTAKQIPGKLWSAISGAISKLATWGSQLLSKAKTAISNVKDAIVNGLKAIPGKIADVGRNIVEGVWNGIKNATGWIKDKIASFASGLVDGVKDALGIKSPSRVFSDMVGKYIPEGIAVGITANADQPLKALNALSEDMLNQDFALNGATINRKLETTFGTPEVDSQSSMIGTLNHKLDTMIEKLGRLQIVLDTGTLVGETIDKIDAGLGTRQTLIARGV